MNTLLTKKFCICITCCSRDYHYLRLALKSVQKQTAAPDEIIIVSSGFHPKELFNIKQLDIQHVSVPVKIDHTVELISAGMARNKAVQSSCDIITFMDVDDQIHPQKMEIVKFVFSNQNLDLFVHSYTLSNNFFIMNNWKDSFYTVENIDEHSTNLDSGMGYWIHHAHCSVKKKILTKIKYKTQIYPCEDGVFCQEVFLSGAKVLASTGKLVFIIR